jgi:hypothetical protein
MANFVRPIRLSIPTDSIVLVQFPTIDVDLATSSAASLESVTIRLPHGHSIRIRVTPSGIASIGSTLQFLRFPAIDLNTYETPDIDDSA